MKHNWVITAILLTFFVLAQVTGLWIINREANLSLDPKTNSTIVTFEDTAVGARPETTGSGSLIYVLIAIAIGTALILLIVKFGRTNLWRIWFFLAVWMALSVSLGSLITGKILFSYDIAIVLALILATWKLLRPNILVHNLTEVLMYAGIGLIIVPLFDVTWAIILLVIISLYDMYAVWKSKHMVKMANFQSKSNVFAGLMVPYSQKSNKIKLSSKMISDDDIPKPSGPKIRPGKTSTKNAILGGGDIAFPLIFIGAVMNGIILKLYNLNPNLSLEAIKATAFLQSSIIIVTTAIALLLLFVFAKKGKFYPAMPFVTAGCLVGWLITLLL
ncbi:MAG: presenilin family intramembrane aspartyl protease [Candidatus Woesearchaeota archaeon]